MKICVLLRRLRRAPGEPSQGPLVGRCDEAALSTALELSSRVAGSRVTVLGAGAADREDEVLLRTLTLGADQAIRIDAPSLDELDGHAASRVLAEAVKRAGGADLVLTGDRSQDEGTGGIGPQVAEWLELPHLTGAVSVEPDPEGIGVIRVVRPSAAKLHTFRLPLPCVVAVARHPGTRAVLDEVKPAAGAPDLLSLEELGIPAEGLGHRDRCLGAVQPIHEGSNATLMADPEELVARLRDDRLLT